MHNCAMFGMLTFLIWTVIFWYAGNCLLRIFYTAIQEGQMLDIAFGWQRMLADLYGSDKKWKNLLGKALGDCQICVSFWFMPVWFAVYWAMTRLILHLWVTDKVESLAAKILVGLVWYLVFHSIGAITGLAGILKLKFKSKEQ